MQIDKQTERQADCYKVVGEKNAEAEIIEFALRKSSTSSCRSSVFKAKCLSTYRNTSLMKRDKNDWWPKNKALQTEEHMGTANLRKNSAYLIANVYFIHQRLVIEFKFPIRIRIIGEVHISCLSNGKQAHHKQNLISSGSYCTRY